MRTRRPDCKCTAGFTLVELLIAVLAFAIVLASINSVFYAALRLRNTTAQATERALPLQQAVAIIKHDLANLVAPGGTLSGELQSSVLANGMAGQVSCEFATAAAVLDATSPWAEVQKVSYALLEATNRMGSKDLYRWVNRNLLAESTQPTGLQWLLGGVRQVTFFYLTDSQWSDTWDSTTETTKLPASIKVRIDLENQQSSGSLIPDPIEIVVPITVQSRTNATAQAQNGGGNP